MCKLSVMSVVVFVLLLAGAAQAARDVTQPGDTIQGVPNDGVSQNDNHGWPGNEPPPQAIDDQVVTNYLHFKGDLQPTGFRVTPSVGPTVVTGLSLATANDWESRDPVEYELSGSHESINGPWTLIASGPIVDFAGATAWPRRTKNTTPIEFHNDIAYEHYQLMFPTIRDAPSANSMQIAEVELLTDVFNATAPIPADGAIGVAEALMQWTPGDQALFHNVYLGTSPELSDADLKGSNLPFALYFHVPGLEPGVTYYWRVDEIAMDGTITPGEVWSFTAMPLIAYAPVPADGDETTGQIPMLSWLPGQGAISHHLYFGNRLEEVESGTAEADRGTMTETSFHPGLLRAATTYYWRVDEFTGSTTHGGDVWSFTTAQPAEGKVVREWWLGIPGTEVAALTTDPDYPNNPDGTELMDLFEGPVDWQDNYGTRLYGWLKPPQTGEYTFWIAGDDEQQLWLSTDEDPANAVQIAHVPGWTPARDFDNTGGGSGDADAQESGPIVLQAGQKYYIEALGKEGSGGDSTAVAWQVPGGTREVIPAEYMDTFAFPPLQAFAPDPANDAVYVAQAPGLVLTWNPGEGAVAHDIYLGDSEQAVAGADPSTYRGQQTETTYFPEPLESGATYYWRIDAISADGTVTPGSVWRFTTTNFVVVDDFERYTDDPALGLPIYDVWIDGFDDPDNGAVVRTEQALPFIGTQSMALEYNNTGGVLRSEVTRTFDVLEDWTREGAVALFLYVRGQAGNDPDQLYVKVQDSDGNETPPFDNPDPDVLATETWSPWWIPLDEVAAEGVNIRAVEKVIIGVRDRDNPILGNDEVLPASQAAGGTGDAYIGLILTAGANYGVLRGYVYNNGNLVSNPQFDLLPIDFPENILSDGSYVILLIQDNYDVTVSALGLSCKWPSVPCNAVDNKKDFDFASCP